MDKKKLAVISIAGVLTLIVALLAMLGSGNPAQGISQAFQWVQRKIANEPDEGSDADMTQWARRHLQTAEERFGSNSNEFAQAAIKLADNEANSNDSATAEDAARLYKRVLSIYESTNANQMKRFSIWIKLADTYYTHDKFADAADAAQKARGIGVMHPFEARGAFVRVYKTLGYSQEYLKRYKDAEITFKEWISLAEQDPPPGQPDLPLKYAALAEVYCLEHQPEKAEPVQRRAFDSLDKIKGIQEKTRGLITYQLAEILRQESKDKEAEQLFKQALAIFENLYKPPYPAITQEWAGLARVYQHEQRFAEAETFAKKSLEACKQTSRGPSDDLITSILTLAHIYESQERYKDAEPLIKEALDLNTRWHGSDNPATAYTAQQLGEDYIYRRMFDQAKPLIENSLAIYKQKLAPDDVYCAYCYRDLVAVYEHEHNSESADKAFQSAMKTTVAISGSNGVFADEMMKDLNRFRDWGSGKTQPVNVVF